MAFTIKVENEATVPVVVCDWCEESVGLDGTVMWGEQHIGLDTRPRAFTTVSRGGTPFSVFTACSAICAGWLESLRGRSLEDEVKTTDWMSVRSFLLTCWGELGRSAD